MAGNDPSWWRRLLGRSRFGFRLTAWRLRLRGRRILTALSAQSDVLRRVGFVVIAFGLAWAVAHSGPGSSASSLSAYLIAVGIMAGGTIAIVLAISVFLLQSSSDLYSSPYLDSYIHDWREKLIYSSVIVITLVLIGGGIWVEDAGAESQSLLSWVFFWSLGSVGVVFALIDWQYSNVRAKINPLRAVLFLEEQGVGFVARVQKDAERLAAVLEARSESVSRDVALAGAYTRILRPQLAHLDGQLGTLADITVRLRERREIRTCKRSITASARILQRYLEARTTSSVLTPSAVSLLAMDSDSGTFMAHSLERLNAWAERFLRDGDEELVLHMLDKEVMHNNLYKARRPV